MPKATAICNSILGLMYRAAAWANVADNAATSPLTSVFISLHTGNLTPATGAQNESESGYTNYARKSTARSAVDWSAPSGGSRSDLASCRSSALTQPSATPHRTDQSLTY